MPSSVINPKSTKPEIIDGALEYIDTTDKQLQVLKEEKQALIILLIITASASILF